MPSSGLEPATAKTLKKQCQEGLKTARQMLTRPLDDAQFTGCTAETDPLARAQALQLEFRQAGIEKSSVCGANLSYEIPTLTIQLYRCGLYCMLTT